MVVYLVKISSKHKTNNKSRWLASDVNFKLLHTGCLIALAYTLNIDQSRSKEPRKMICFFIIFKCSHDAVSKMCLLEFSYQNLRFSKSAGKKMCRFRVNGRSIRHIFHLVQNVPVSCEWSLKEKKRFLRHNI